MKNKKHEFAQVKEGGIVSTVILVVITIVITAALATVNFFTYPIITANAKATADASRAEVFEAAASFEDVSKEFLPEKRENLTSVIKALDDRGDLIGLVIETYGSGYGGAVSIMVGISTEHKLVGIAVLSQDETPGLGSKILQESFTGQFLNRSPGLLFSFQQADAEQNDVDAITASTISSKAVLTAVNAAVSLAEEVFTKIGSGGEE